VRSVDVQNNTQIQAFHFQKDKFIKNVGFTNIEKTNFYQDKKDSNINHHHVNTNYFHISKVGSKDENMVDINLKKIFNLQPNKIRKRFKIDETLLKMENNMYETIDKFVSQISIICQLKFLETVILYSN
jgi:hypothetical protein